MTGNSSLLAEEGKVEIRRKEEEFKSQIRLEEEQSKIELRRKDEEFKVKQLIEKDKPLMTQKVKDLNTETNRLLTNIDEILIQMSDLGESGVQDYRSADENGKAKILNEAQRLIEDQDYAGASVGMTGAFLSMISGTDASQLESKMEDIKSNIMISTMQEMRKGSSAGATGLGAINEKELKALQSRLGALNISDPMTMYKSLIDIRKDFARINQRQQEIYQNTYGELPIEKPTRNDGLEVSVKNGKKTIKVNLLGEVIKDK